ncbi:MAG: hypothetical protein IDH49_04330 [Gammaproteobacteria bacterium]|nr:hypothetical protein [Gammaproteobacteria bacterium]
MNKTLLASALLLMALLSTSCSVVSLGYNNANWYLRYKITGYTSFDTSQKERIRQEVDNFMVWHRSAMLPEYAAFLRKIDRLLQTGVIGKEDVAALRSELRGLMKKTLEPAITPTARILNRLDHGQIHELAHNLNEDNRKRGEELLSGTHEDRLSKRAEKTIDIFEDFTGNLSSAQEEKITRMSRELPFATAIFLKTRQSNQTHIAGLLRQKAGQDKLASFMKLWLLTPEKTRIPDDQRIVEEFEAGSDQMIASGYALLTAQQKERLRESVLDYITEIEALNKQTEMAQKQKNGKAAMLLDPFDLSRGLGADHGVI